MQNPGLALLLTFFFALPAKSYAYRISDVDFTLEGKLSEAYDDNITYVNANQKNDFITTISLGGDAKYEGETKTLGVSGNVNRQFFADNNNFNNNSEDFSLAFLNELSKFDRINVKDSFSHAYEPRSFEDAFGRPGGRYGSYRNGLALGYARDITRQFRISARYSNKADTYSREDLADSYSNSAGFEAGYALNSDTGFFTSYDLSKRSFHPGARSSTHSLAAGLRQYLTKQFYFDGKAGEDFIKSYNGKEYAKPSFSASFTNDLEQNTNANISFTKQYYANSYSQDLFDYWQVSGGLSRRLLERLGCSVSVFYGKGNYIPAIITDKLSGLSADFTYDIRRDLKGNLSYSFSETKSTVESREYRKNTVSLGLTAQF